MQQFQAEVNISKTRGRFFLKPVFCRTNVCGHTPPLLHVTCYVKDSPLLILSCSAEFKQSYYSSSEASCFISSNVRS